MTVKDQIPSFPELIAVSIIRDLIAHGSDDYNVIASKYHSNPEREHADELALNRIIELLRTGLIRALAEKVIFDKEVRNDGKPNAINNTQEFANKSPKHFGTR